VKLFISYARKDGSELAFRLERDLRARGFDVWRDVSRLDAGRVWSIAIEHALSDCDCVLALISPASHTSGICRGEQLIAADRGKLIIPILVTTTLSKPIHLYATQHIDFSDPDTYNAQFELLVNALALRRTPSAHYAASQRAFSRHVPPLPRNYVARPEELNALRDAVLREDSAQQIAVTGIRGMGGIGKSVLAAALARDPVIQAAFPDGQAWVRLGPGLGDLATHMRSIAEQLGESTLGFDDTASSILRIRQILAEEAILLILDDVWAPEPVELLHADAPRSRLVFTTRLGSIAPRVGANEYELELLDAKRSLDLLQLWSKCDPVPPEALDLIHECGHLPLAIQHVGALLRGKPLNRWSDLLHDLRNESLQEFPPVFRAIRLSVEFLEPALQERYQELAVFSPEAGIPESILALFWGLEPRQVHRIVDTWVDLSLASRDPEGRLLLVW
jgi:hypothetical protein